MASKFDGLRKRAPYKVFYGGRGAAKSWAFARALVTFTNMWGLRVLCVREFQTSIGDSVHRLLADQIALLGLSDRFQVQEKTIRNLYTGAEFIFKGLHNNDNGIKSTEGINICWVEEAQSVSARSWQVLLPTIRTVNAEIWVSFNPDDENDPTYQNFVINPPPGAIVEKVGWEDNPYFPEVLERQRQHMLATDPEAYEHVWGGSPRKIGEAIIFGKRVSFETFETPQGVRFHFGADWGFANDPTALIRSFIRDDCLYIDYEAFGYGVELDDLWKLFSGKDGATPEQLALWQPGDDAKYPGVPGARLWPIKADSARPETISYMRRHGFNIDAAEKWPGSVEDGVAHLKAFKRIIVHERCKHIGQEFRLYSYKVDKQSGDILPIIVDKHNHGLDALRYSLDGYIQRRGSMGVWAKLAS
jgi:phage terminase large subunit